MRIVFESDGGGLDGSDYVTHYRAFFDDSKAGVASMYKDAADKTVVWMFNGQYVPLGVDIVDYLRSLRQEVTT